MLSLDAAQLALVAADDKNIRWAITVTDINDIEYTSAAYVMTDFSGVELRRNMAENTIIAPSNVTFSISNAGDALDFAVFKGGSVLIELYLSTVALAEQKIAGWKFRIKTADPSYQNLKITAEDFLQTYLNGTYPNTRRPDDIFPSNRTYTNDALCVPVPFGTAYVPLRDVFIDGEGGFILLGDTVNTYTITKIRSPRSWGVKSEWDSGSYTFTQSTKADADAANWRVFQAMIADGAAGFWGDPGGPILDPPVQFSRSDTAAITNPADVIAFVLKDMGIPDARIDEAGTFATAHTTFDGWGLTFNGAFWYKQDREKVLAQLLTMCHSCFDVGETIKLRVLSKTSQKTITGAEIQRTVEQGEGTFTYRDLANEDLSDSGFVAYQPSGESQDELVKALVGVDGSPDVLSNDVLECPFVQDSQDVKRIGTLHFERKLMKEAEAGFTTKGTCLALQPDDVITINDTNYGGSYAVLVDSVKIGNDISIRFVCSHFSISFNDWADLTPAVLTIPDDSTDGSWQIVISGPDDDYDLNALSGMIRVGTTSSNILITPHDPLRISMYDAGSEIIRLGNLNAFAGYTSAKYGLAAYIDANNYIKIDPTNGIRMSGDIIITGGSMPGLTLDDLADGASYGRVALTAISAGKIVLTSSGVTGTLPTALSAAKCTDVNADQTSANVAASISGQGALATKGSVDLATGEVTNKNLDNIANGATYGRVNLTAISAGKILLTSAGVSGSLPTSLSDAKCTDVNADQTSANTCNDPWGGHDLDDLANGTYGKVLTTAISAGKIVLTSAGVTGTLPTSLSAAKCTDVNADQTSVNVAASVSGQGNLATLNTVNATYIDAGSITLVKCAVETTNQMFSSAANRTNIEAWRHASDATLIDGGDIYADSVTATQIILGTNLLPNSDFSSWDASDDAIYWDGYILKGTVAYLKEYHGYFNGAVRCYSSYYIPVRPNTTYVLSAWLNSETSGTARVEAIEYDINKANPTGFESWRTDFVSSGGTWTRKEIAKRTNATTYFVRIACLSNTSGKWGGFDCIQFEQAGPDGSDLASIAKASEWSSAGVTQIHGGQIVATNLAVISADLGSITAGTITMPSTGWIKGGQTDFATGTGFFLGHSGGAYVFSFGSSTKYIKWDASDLLMSDGLVQRHNLPLFAVGDLLEIYSDATVGATSTTPVKVKEIYIVRKGVLRIKFKMTGTLNLAHARIYRNGGAIGTIRHGTGGTWDEHSQDIVGWSPGDYVQIYAWHDTAGFTTQVKDFRLYSNKPCVNLVIT